MNVNLRMLFIVPLTIAFAIKSENTSIMRHAFALSAQKQENHNRRTSFRNELRNFAFSCLNKRSFGYIQNSSEFEPDHLPLESKEYSTLSRAEQTGEAFFSSASEKEVQDVSQALYNQKEELLTYAQSSTLFGGNNPRFKKRAAAIVTTFQNNYVYKKEYSSNTIKQFALQFAHINRADLEQCVGTEIQQVMHQEVLDILQKSNSLQNLPHTNALYAATMQSAGLALKTNQAGCMLQTIELSDFCWIALECMRGICDGLQDGVYRVVHSFTHPVQTAYDIADTVAHLSIQFGRLLTKLGGFEYDLEYALEHAHEPVLQDTQEAQYVFSKLSGLLQQMSAREKTKIATSCITEGFLIGKVCLIGAQFFSKAQIKLADAVATNFSGALEPVYVTAEGVELAIAQQTAEVLCSSTAGGVSTGSGGYKKFTRGFIPPFDKIKRLQMLFDNKYKAPHPLDKLLLTFNFEHFLYPDVKRIIQKSGRIRDRLTGFHHDYLLQIEQQGVVKIINKQFVHESGVYIADVIWRDKKIKAKTFFPSDWTQEKVIEEILTSFDDLSYKPYIDNDAWILEGFSKSNIKIQTIILPNGHVKTSFPYYRV